MRKNRKFTDAIRLNYLEEYLHSSFNRNQFEKEKGLKPDTIRRWLHIFGVEDKPKAIMSEKLNQTEQELHDKISELEQQLSLLKVELKQTTMARDAYNCMIDLAEETYNIKVRKNSDAK